MRDRCFLTMSFAIATVVELSQCTGVGGCGWPSSSRLSHRIIPSWQLQKRATNSASAANAMTNLHMLATVKTGPFNWTGLVSIGIHP